MTKTQLRTSIKVIGEKAYNILDVYQVDKEQRTEIVDNYFLIFKGCFDCSYIPNNATKQQLDKCLYLLITWFDTYF